MGRLKLQDPDFYRPHQGSFLILWRSLLSQTRTVLCQAWPRRHKCPKLRVQVASPATPVYSSSPHPCWLLAWIPASHAPVSHHSPPHPRTSSSREESFLTQLELQIPWDLSLCSQPQWRVPSGAPGETYPAEVGAAARPASLQPHSIQTWRWGEGWRGATRLCSASLCPRSGDSPAAFKALLYLVLPHTRTPPPAVPFPHRRPPRPGAGAAGRGCPWASRC